MAESKADTSSESGHEEQEWRACMRGASQSRGRRIEIPATQTVHHVVSSHARKLLRREGPKTECGVREDRPELWGNENCIAYVKAEQARWARLMNHRA